MNPSPRLPASYVVVAISGDGRFVAYSSSWQMQSQDLTQTTKAVWLYETLSGSLKT